MKQIRVEIRTAMGALITGCALAAAAPALAHHSFAMFDRKTDLVLSGTVKEFQWQNPHSYIQLISDKDTLNWTIEAGGVNGLVRQSWKRNSLQPGDKVTVHLHPLRNGAPGGELMWVQKADGSTLGKMGEGPQGE